MKKVYRSLFGVAKFRDLALLSTVVLVLAVSNGLLAAVPFLAIGIEEEGVAA